MDKITSQAVNELLDNAKSPAVTIYCPMLKPAAPPNLTEEQIRFKNLIHKAVDLLKKRIDGKGLQKELCDYLDELLADQKFWETQTSSLLICAQPESIRMFQLPVDTEEYVAVDDSFHLAPILGILQDAQEFYVLAIAQHAPALLKGDMYGLSPTNVSLPETLVKGLNLDEVNQKSEHARSADGSSMGPAGFHGRGGARDPHEEDRARFFRMIDNAVCSSVDRSLPLILAGIDAETAEYRALSKYPKILNTTVKGSFSGAKPQDLFEPAYQIISDEIINAKHKEAVEEYKAIKGATPDKVASTKKAIAQAAEQGRIDKLLIRIFRYTTDTVNDTRQAMSRITFPELALSSTMNNLANKVWQTSGKIISLDATEMPDGAALAARLRY